MDYQDIVLASITGPIMALIAIIILGRMLATF